MHVLDGHTCLIYAHCLTRIQMYKDDDDSDFDNNNKHDDDGDDEDQYDSTFDKQKLKAAVHYYTAKICESESEKLGMHIPKQTLAALTDLVYNYAGMCEYLLYLTSFSATLTFLHYYLTTTWR